jgi:hypothetical protein
VERRSARSSARQDHRKHDLVTSPTLKVEAMKKELTGRAQQKTVHFRVQDEGAVDQQAA